MSTSRLSLKSYTMSNIHLQLSYYQCFTTTYFFLRDSNTFSNYARSYLVIPASGSAMVTVLSSYPIRTAPWSFTLQFVNYPLKYQPFISALSFIPIVTHTTTGVPSETYL